MLIRPTKFICCFLLFDWLINFETAVLYSVPTLIIIFHHWLSFDKLLSLSRLAAAAHASRPDSSLKARLSSKIIDIAEQQFVAFQATKSSSTDHTATISAHTCLAPVEKIFLASWQASTHFNEQTINFRNCLAQFYTTNSSSINIRRRTRNNVLKKLLLLASHSQNVSTTTPNSCLYDSSRSFQSQDVEQHLRVNRHSDQLENSTST
ncbi:hypothetical protein T06_3156 [Trichinella sp. T6]|uniref:Uncharacterized protein n=1 Tax=Trichinella murrelli TaxID=144512 RepID=A0A0V0TT40_9BILA|nr:hypothetical protein T05_5709 [Trichinella murrelli]KRX73919.1 hypothetical protein T06_3156 [Trichinella sp. T6]KRZ85412.1 hypothetical protein T08_11674 [Trichinella sp. T8]